MPSGAGPSSLLLLEYLSAQDGRFLELLLQASDPKTLATVAETWKKDHRPWARQQILDYLDQPMLHPGHQPLVRRLFKNAEEKGDHELTGAFVAAFDVIVRRRLRTRHQWDRQSRAAWTEQYLRANPDTIPPGAQVRIAQNPKTLERITVPVLMRPGDRLFSGKTRAYLRRRAWRYFRRLAHRKPADYITAVALGLKRYRDKDLARGENILDCWGLMHACFFAHPAIRIGVSHVNLAPGHSLAELSATPYLAKLWKTPQAAGVLLGLVTGARSRLVRVWAMQLLRADHAANLAEVPVAQLLGLLDHPDEEVQQFGAELLEKAQGLETLPLETWLGLLGTKNPTALAAICELMRKHVSADRLDLRGRIELAMSRATPVARLGFEYLKTSAITTSADREAVAELAGARCESIGREMAGWALRILGEKSVYATDRIVPFFDSLNAAIRAGAWEWLVPESAGWGDSSLYARLLETPYEDIRLKLVASLEKRSGLPGAGAKDLSAIWCAVLLGVHRGGRHKLKALRQIAGALEQDPKHAEMLLPVLAIAMRSVRAPEARGGLAAVVGVVERRPEMQAIVEKYFPELELMVTHA
ncbi:MAG: hypothetical protein ACHRHE_19675 [Tepidisphaerales bacterium]